MSLMISAKMAPSHSGEPFEINVQQGCGAEESWSISTWSDSPE